MRNRLFTILIWMLSSLSWAGVPDSLVFEGELELLSGATVNEEVTFTFQILSADGSCLLYEESQGVDLALTQGKVSLGVGSSVTNSKRTSNDPGLSMTAIFSNTGQLRGSSADCSGGYSPGANDVRKLRVKISSPSLGSDTLSPDRTLSSSAFAHNAGALQGLLPADFIQNTQSGMQQALEDLVTGSGTLAGQPISTTPPSNGQTLVWDSSQNSWVPGSAGGSVTPSIPVENTSASTGSLTLNSTSPTTNYVNFTSGGVITLPDATTLSKGYQLQLLIEGGETVIKNHAGGIIGMFNEMSSSSAASSSSSGSNVTRHVVRLVLFDNSNSGGNWRVFDGLNELRPYASVDRLAAVDEVGNSRGPDYYGMNRIQDDLYIVHYVLNDSYNTKRMRMFRVESDSTLTFGPEVTVDSDTYDTYDLQIIEPVTGTLFAAWKKNSANEVGYRKFTYNPSTLVMTGGTAGSMTTNSVSDNNLRMFLITPTLAVVAHYYYSGGSKYNLIPVQINSASGVLTDGAELLMTGCCGAQQVIPLGTAGNFYVDRGGQGAYIQYNSGLNSFTEGPVETYTGQLIGLDSDSVAAIESFNIGNTRELRYRIADINTGDGTHTFGSEVTGKTLSYPSGGGSNQLFRNPGGSHVFGFYPMSSTDAQVYKGYDIGFNGAAVTFTEVPFFYSSCNNSLMGPSQSTVCMDIYTRPGDSYEVMDVFLRKGAD